MDDETRLKETKLRLRNLRGGQSLFALSELKIVKNIGYFVDKKGNPLRKLCSLPCCLREQLLKHLTNIKCRKKDGDLVVLKRHIKALHLLLCPQTKTIELNGLMSFCPAQLKYCYYTKVLQMIATLAPNVQFLEITDGRCEERSCYITEEMLTPIKSLSKLKKLRVDSLCIEYNALKTLCREMPSLRYVDVIIDFYWNTDDLENDISDFESSFSHLTCFLFSGVILSMLRFEEWLKNLCIRHLPNLRVVHSLATCNITDIHIGIEEGELPLQPILPPLQESELRHLSVIVVPGLSELHQNLPKVTHLKVTPTVFWEQDDLQIDSLLEFPAIQSLCLQQVPPPQILDRFLDKYGRNLRALYFAAEYYENLDYDLQLDSVCKSCPNLEKLCLRHLRLLDDFSKNYYLPKLRELEWAPGRATRGACLSNILSAPNLEKISLLTQGDFDFDLSDLKKVSTLICQGKILRRLTNFKFQLLYCIPLKKTNVEYFKALSELLKNASAFLPNLLDLDGNFYFNTESRTPFDKSLTHGEMEAAFESLGGKNLIKFFYAYRKCTENLEDGILKIK
ncbi:Hypothetical predicted protein [Cloeon dipterum]|uniref:F-box domain-containing protein n=1 Tax=Cloeon dipterum TaxID=197152 RepID=A0A8S1DAX2_9INSE|nr:Hypothetical predicted protein [Cloeon dipterum]